MEYIIYRNSDELYHHGIKGMKWGVRRYQNYDGSLTSAGKTRYGSASDYTPSSEKEQKAYYKNVKTILGNKYASTSEKFKKIAEGAPSEATSDLRPIGKTVVSSMKKYQKTYDTEVEKLLDDTKKLQAYSDACGFIDKEKPSSLTLKTRFLVGYAYGDDVLKRSGHTTKTLEADKKALDENTRKLYSEATDYTNKILGKYGDKPVTEYIYSNTTGATYYRTGMAKHFVSAALQTDAVTSTGNPDNARALASRSRIDMSAFNGMMDKMSNQFSSNTVGDMSISEFRRIIHH